MAGQTVVSRNKKLPSPSAPVKNPFRGRHRFRWNASSSPRSGAMSLLAFLVCVWTVWTWKVSIFGLPESSSSNNNNNNNGLEIARVMPPDSQLHLRPAYLTDDGIEDEDDSTDDAGSDEEDEATEKADTATVAEEEGDATEAPNDKDENDSKNDKEEGDATEAPNDKDENENDSKNDPAKKDDANDAAANAKDRDSNNKPESVVEEKQVRRPHSPKSRSQSQSTVFRNVKIPRNLIFTHYKNLLDLLPPSDDKTSDVAAANPSNVAAASDFPITPEKLEELTLAVNVRHSIDVHTHANTNANANTKANTKANTHNRTHPPLRVLFWNDRDCIDSLERTRPGLVPYFRTEPEGMYKADVCRGTALLEHGGFYLDVDVGVRHDLWEDLREDTEFVTARVHSASNWVGRGFFQAVVGAAPRSPVLERYLELFEKHYNGTRRVAKGPLGVLLLYEAWEQVLGEAEANENANSNTNANANPSVPTELYQELLYSEHGPLNTGPNKGAVVPAPTWGKRRACHFLVAAMANHPSEQPAEVVLEPPRRSGAAKAAAARPVMELRIPVLSRIPGSRMCVEPFEADAKADAGDKANDKAHSSSDQRRRIESMRWWERTT